MAQDTVAQIKERLSIMDIVSPYVKLHRAGRSMVGLCPFHKEKTGSFHVSPERGSWHCFGCGEGGDGFAFIEKIEGVDFKGALKILADKAGVVIEYSGSGNREDASKKDRLRELMARALEWYAEQLHVGFTKPHMGEGAYAYAKKRGLTEESIKAWSLGYAPDAWRALLEAFTAQGFTIPELLAAGLVKEADSKPGTYYDRFRNRLMFPIRDVAGHAVAFTGRALSPDEQAKYLNSPETELYHKSEILFGLDKAKDAIRVRGFTLLVEGQLDVLMAHQAGFTNAVALSGTAFTERHGALMKRYSENLMLMLDADPAGLKATARSAALALGQGIRVKAVSLPEGMDPADLVTSSDDGAKEFSKRVASAKPIVEFFLDELSRSEHDPHRLVRKAEAIVLPLIIATPSPMEREHFVQIAARALGLSGEAVRESLKRVPRESREQTQGRTLNSNIQGSTLKTVPARSVSDARAEQLLAVLHAYPDTSLAKRVKSEYCRITEVVALPEEVPPESAVFEVEQAFGEAPLEDAADELLRAFESAVIREAYQGAVTDLRRAEAGGNASAIAHAQAVCADLSRRLAKLG